MRSFNKNSKSKRNYRQLGGRAEFPVQYFGGSLSRYYPEGSEELKVPDSSYGETIATSFGKSVPSLTEKNMVGPDLAAFPKPSGIQTGGKRKSSKKGGSVVTDLVSEASNLIAPVGLLAARNLLKKRQKAGKKTIRKNSKKGGSVVTDLVSEASNLIVPVGLLAARKLLKKRQKGGK